MTQDPVRSAAPSGPAGDTANWGREVRWRTGRVGKRLRRMACSRLYRDDFPDTRLSCLIAGTARSGTTWLAEVVASQRPCRVMFEPFNPRMVRAYAQFHYFQYMRPAASNEELSAYCRGVFTGAFRDPWVDREVDVLRPRCRVVKDIRANLMLKWLRREFPEVPMLLIVRHPCAVVASRMRLGWATDSDIDSFKHQPDLVQDFLADRLPAIEAARTDEAKHAIIWCVSNLVPLAQFATGGLTVVHYEDLCARPEAELGRVFACLGAEFRASRFDGLGAPSRTTRAGSAILTGEDPLTTWSKQLSARQVRNVLEMVDRFGLSHLYGESTVPGPRAAHP